MPVEGWLLEAAVEAAEVDVEKHWYTRDLAGLAELEEVVLEELVAFHGCTFERFFVASLLRMTWAHHTFTTFWWVFGGFGADDN